MVRHWRPLAILVMAGLILANAPLLRAADDAALNGKWKLTIFQGPNQVASSIVDLKVEDGKITQSSLKAVNPQVSLAKAAIEGKDLTLTLKARTGEERFIGRLPAKDAKTIRGVIVAGERVMAAELVRTEDTAINAKEASEPVAGLKEYAEVTGKVQTLVNKILATQDAEARNKLMQEYREAMQASQKESPKLLAEALKQADVHPAGIVFAVPMVLRNARTGQVNAEQAGKYARQAAEAAKSYGPVLQQEIATQLAEILVANPDLAKLAGEYARTAEKLLQERDAAARKVRALKVLARVLKSEKKDGDLKKIEARLEGLESEMDKEYLANVPPFKPAPFQGRKANTTSTVVMELFTGAQCPPCVAADVAFDALQKAYKPTDLILIQYHMHIPGPDPLTNADSEARFKYYQTAFPKDMRGTPSTLFNGKPASGGGGNMAMSEGKFGSYRGIIDPLFEETAGAKLTGTATRKGNKIEIKVNVADLQEPSEEKKLRLVLVEETIRYVGGNQLRFHHQVVRGMPGGTEGVALKDKTMKHEVTVDLDEVKQKLNSYLDDYAAKRPFPSADRPMDLKNLRVIAFVQDDKDQKILQGLQIEVSDNVAAR